MSLQIAVEALDVGHLVRLTGRLDTTTSADAEKKLLELFQANGSKAAIDCSALDYISSAGLRVILMVAKKARQGQGKMVLFGLQPNVREVFEISGFLRILDVAADRGAAQASLSA
jgi:anti-anti-sigma factor